MLTFKAVLRREPLRVCLLVREACFLVALPGGCSREEGRPAAPPGGRSREEGRPAAPPGGHTRGRSGRPASPPGGRSREADWDGAGVSEEGEGRRPAVGRERGGAPDPDLLGCGRRGRGSLREKAWRFQRSDGRAAFQNAVLRRIFWRWRWK